MTTYIMLANMTDAGTKSIRDLPHRLDTAKRLLKDMGGEFKSFFLTMGNTILSRYTTPRMMPSQRGSPCSSGPSAMCARKRSRHSRKPLTARS